MNKQQLDIFQKNILRTTVKINPKYLNKNYKGYILDKLIDEYENKFTKFGLIKTNSIKNINIISSLIEQNSLEGYVIFDVNFEALICNPVINDIILCKVVNQNNFGVLCIAYDDNKEDIPIIEIVVFKKSKALKSNVNLDDLDENQMVYINIVAKNTELNDTKIRCIGYIVKLSNINKVSKSVIIRKPDNTEVNERVVINTETNENSDELNEEIDDLLNEDYEDDEEDNNKSKNNEDDDDYEDEEDEEDEEDDDDDDDDDEEDEEDKDKDVIEEEEEEEEEEEYIDEEED